MIRSAFSLRSSFDFSLLDAKNERLYKTAGPRHRSDVAVSRVATLILVARMEFFNGTIHNDRYRHTHCTSNSGSKKRRGRRDKSTRPKIW